MRVTSNIYVKLERFIKNGLVALQLYTYTMKIHLFIIETKEKMTTEEVIFVIIHLQQLTL